MNCLGSGYRRFKRKICVPSILYFKDGGAYSSEVLVTPSRVHGIVTEKNTILIDTVFITLYLL